MKANKPGKASKRGVRALRSKARKAERAERETERLALALASFDSAAVSGGAVPKLACDNRERSRTAPELGMVPRPCVVQNARPNVRRKGGRDVQEVRCRTTRVTFSKG